jgi:sterol 3beta-glucosyltransferase
MRIAVLAYGSQGDVRPFVALGIGLRAAGHEVWIVTDTGFRPMVEAAGLGYRPVQGDVQALLKQRNGLSAVTGNPLRALRLMRRLTMELAPVWARDTLAACEGAEALVAGNAAAFMAASIVEQRRLPLVQGWLQPIAPTGDFASPLVPPMRLPGGAARLTHHLFRRLVWLAARTAAHELRDRIGLPRWSGAKAAWAALETVPAFCAVSPALVPRPADWRPTAAMTGFLFLDTGQAPDPVLRAFVEAGETPLYLGFGSMVARHPVQAAEACVAAIGRLERRAVVVTGWGGLDPAPLLAARDRGMKLHVTEAVPHTWLLPRVAASVHHGGAGTTAATARAGVPSVVVPFLGDQFFWAARLHAAGAAPPPVPIGRLSARRLEAALAQALGDTTMRDRAAALGQAIRTEDGMAGAVAVVEQAIA